MKTFRIVVLTALVVCVFDMLCSLPLTGMMMEYDTPEKMMRNVFTKITMKGMNME